MREIKFRGKRIDNGEWVHGYIVKVASPCGLGWVMHIPAKDPDDNHRVVQVNPATVGQYTGLKDKNGVEIYEGDVVSYKGEPSIVVYDIGEYKLKMNGKEYLQAGLFSWNYYMEVIGNIYMEVIGNIHDNAELVEVE